MNEQIIILELLWKLKDTFLGRMVTFSGQHMKRLDVFDVVKYTNNPNMPTFSNAYN